MIDAMLQVEQLTMAYGPRIAVDSVTFNLDRAEVVAIVGPNGAGKSSLLQSINGSLIPQTGKILLNGKPLTGYSRRAVSRNIAVVAQEADLRFPVTVLEFVLGGRYAWAGTTAWGWETENDLQVAKEVLDQTELTNLESRLMNELSGGERQRCLLARALATEASLLLLDEPTANLDLAHQASILALVRSRCDERQIAALVITHDINLAAQFSNRVLLMKQGRQVALGKPKDVLTPHLLRQVFEVEVLVDSHPVTGVPRITPVHQLNRPV
jgi:iron complex transport system ATP-binding protein